MGGPGQGSCLMLSWIEDQTAFLSFLWRLETWLLSYWDSCFGQMLFPSLLSDRHELEDGAFLTQKLKSIHLAKCLMTHGCIH